MRVLALVEHEGHVCCRYRLRAFRQQFSDNGVSLEIRAIPKRPVERWKLFWQCRSFDAVILQRKLLARVEQRWLRQCAKRLYFDCDDAVYLRDSYSGKGFHSAKRLRRFKHIVGLCDAVIVGNHTLAVEAEKHSAEVCIIPTCVEPADYPVQAAHTRTGAEVRLVWLGSRSTLQGLIRQATLMDAIGDAVPGIRLRVICDAFPKFDRLPVDAIQWGAGSEAAELADADIGLGYVPDDPWSRGKCALKLLQYHAAGLAVVANPVGVQAEMVRTGDTGMSVTSVGEWCAAIRILANDPALRQRLGTAGHTQVQQQYSVRVGGKFWLDLLQ